MMGTFTFLKVGEKIISYSPLFQPITVLKKNPTNKNATQTTQKKPPLIVCDKRI